MITPDYFDVMGIRMEAGRAFAADDMSGPAVAIVSAATAQRYWPGESPIGKHVRFIGEPHWREIVGVVSDVRAYDLVRSLPEWMDGTIYVPHGPNATLEDGRIPDSMTLVLRTGMDAAGTAALLRDRVARVTSDLVVSDVRPMSAVVADMFAAPAATATVLAAMAVLALVLGCVGIYGVLSFLVARQTRDFGIRIAIGAQPRHVLWLVIREGAMLCMWGVALGIGCALAVTRWLSSELHGISPADPLTYLAVTAAVSVVTLLACYVPTRRAMTVDPLTALRQG